MQLVYANFLTIANKLTLFKIKEAAPFEAASLNVMTAVYSTITFLTVLSNPFSINK